MRSIALAICLWSATGLAGAAEFTLQSGTRVEGDLLRVEDTRAVIKTSSGVVTYPIWEFDTATQSRLLGGATATQEVEATAATEHVETPADSSPAHGTTPGMAVGGSELALLGAGLGVIALILLVALLINAGFLLLAARIVGIEGRSLGRAIGIVILSGIAGIVVSLVAGALGPVGPLVSLLVGFIVQAAITAGLFSTSFGKALGACVIAWILSFVVGAILVGLLIVLGFAAALPFLSGA